MEWRWDGGLRWGGPGAASHQEAGVPQSRAGVVPFHALGEPGRVWGSSGRASCCWFGCSLWDHYVPSTAVVPSACGHFLALSCGAGPGSPGEGEPMLVRTSVLLPARSAQRQSGYWHLCVGLEALLVPFLCPPLLLLFRLGVPNWPGHWAVSGDSAVRNREVAI